MRLGKLAAVDDAVAPKDGFSLPKYDWGMTFSGADGRQIKLTAPELVTQDTLPPQPSVSAVNTSPDVPVHSSPESLLGIIMHRMDAMHLDGMTEANAIAAGAVDMAEKREAAAVAAKAEAAENVKAEVEAAKAEAEAAKVGAEAARAEAEAAKTEAANSEAEAPTTDDQRRTLGPLSAHQRLCVLECVPSPRPPKSPSPRPPVHASQPGK